MYIPDIQLLDLCCKQKRCVHLSLVFGYVYGTAICQRVTDAITFICNEHGHRAQKYINDFIRVDVPDRAQPSYIFLQGLL